jgi:excisionase family DNA binding protein
MARVQVDLSEEITPLREEIEELRGRIAQVEALRSDDRLCLSIREVARTLSISPSKAHQMVSGGDLREVAVRLGGRTVIYRKKLIEWIEAQLPAGEGPEWRVLRRIG